MKSACFCLALLQSHVAALLIDPISNNHRIPIQNYQEDAATSGDTIVAGKVAAWAQTHLGISSHALYPSNLTYTTQHIWFGPDVNVSKTRIGTTTYLISHLLDNDIDGAAFPLDHNEVVEPGQSLGKLFGANENDFDIEAPFAAVFETANLDMNLNGMVDNPYNDEGFLALLIGSPPATPPSTIRFMNGSEYAAYVAGL